MDCVYRIEGPLPYRDELSPIKPEERNSGKNCKTKPRITPKQGLHKAKTQPEIPTYNGLGITQRSKPILLVEELGLTGDEVAVADKATYNVEAPDTGDRTGLMLCEEWMTPI